MQATIRHDSTGRTIAAYLAAVEGTRWIRHIVGYMQLLHSTPAGCTRQALADLAQRKVIIRVARGRYQRSVAQ